MLRPLSLPPRFSTPLHTHCRTNNHQRLRAELNKYPLRTTTIRNADGDTPLHVAVENGSRECVRILLQRSQNHPSIVNAKNTITGDTPLQVAWMHVRSLHDASWDSTGSLRVFAEIVKDLECAGAWSYALEQNRRVHARIRDEFCL